MHTLVHFSPADIELLLAPRKSPLGNERIALMGNRLGALRDWAYRGRQSVGARLRSNDIIGAAYLLFVALDSLWGYVDDTLSLIFQDMRYWMEPLGTLSSAPGSGAL